MNTYADKTQGDNRQSVAYALYQKKNGGEPAFQYAKNRSESMAQRNLQEMANNSPQVKQLKAFQDIANNSPQTKQANLLQAMVDNDTAKKHPMHKKETQTGLSDHFSLGITAPPIQRVRRRTGAKVNTSTDDPDQLQAAVDLVNRGEAYEEYQGEVQELLQRIHDLRNPGSRYAAPPLEPAFDMAWGSVSGHAMNVDRSAPNVAEDPRNQGTRSTLMVSSPNGPYPVSGSSGGGRHAESASYDRVWDSAGGMADDWVADQGLPGGQNQHYALQRQFFDQMIDGAMISCEGHKASCFMCSGIAGSIGVTVEKSDNRGYTSYKLPTFLLESPLHLRQFLGEQAYAYYLSLKPADQLKFLQQIGSILYQKHKGKGGYFDPPGGGGGLGGGGMGGGGKSGGGIKA